MGNAEQQQPAKQFDAILYNAVCRCNIRLSIQMNFCLLHTADSTIGQMA